MPIIYGDTKDNDGALYKTQEPIQLAYLCNLDL